MKPNQVTPHSIDTSKDLLLSARGASTTYMIYPEEESQKKVHIEAENQKAIISNDMNKFMLLAESKKDLAQVVKSNALKGKSDESK